MINQTPDVITTSECLDPNLDLKDVKTIKGCSDYRLQFLPTQISVGSLHLPIGLQGSGKSTMWQKTLINHFQQHNLPYDVIHPDKIREHMLQSEKTGVYHDVSIEEDVWKEAKMQMERCLNSRKHCLLDATNVSTSDPHHPANKGRNDFFNMALDRKLPVYVSVLNIHPEIALYRDTKRTRSVGREVINTTYDKLKKNYEQLYESKAQHQNLGYDFSVGLVNHEITPHDCKNLGGTINPISKTCDVSHITQIQM